MYFYEILQSIMDEKNLKISDIARLSGLTDSTVRSIISRKNKTIALEVAFKLANGLGVSIERLNGEEPSLESNNKHKKEVPTITDDDMIIINKYHKLDSHGKRMVDMAIKEEYKRWEAEQLKRVEPKEQNLSTRIIPYCQKLASAGNGQLLFDDFPTDQIEIPDTHEYRNIKYAVGVNGDSMEPMFIDGDKLLIEPTNWVDEGEIGIFLVDGESFVKQKGNNILISLNKKRDNIQLTQESKCIGRVVDKLFSSGINKDQMMNLISDNMEQESEELNKLNDRISATEKDNIKKLLNQSNAKKNA